VPQLSYKPEQSGRLERITEAVDLGQSVQGLPVGGARSKARRQDVWSEVPQCIVSEELTEGAQLPHELVIRRDHRWKIAGEPRWYAIVGHRVPCIEDGADGSQ